MRRFRPRFRMLTLLMGVAIFAVGINGLRSIHRAEAERIAETKFLSIPGASRWAGRYQVQADAPGTFVTDQPKRFQDGWTVVVSGSKDGIFLMQMLLSPRGKMRAVDFAPGNFNELVPVDPSGKR